MIVVGGTLEEARRWFHEVTVIAERHNPYKPSWGNNPVLLCRGKHSLR